MSDPVPTPPTATPAAEAVPPADGTPVETTPGVMAQAFVKFGLAGKSRDIPFEAFLMLEGAIGAERLSGAPPPVADPVKFNSWDQRFRKQHFAVIESERGDERAAMLARQLAHQGSFDAVYATNELKMRPNEDCPPGELIRLLTGHPRETRCLILEWYGAGVAPWLASLAGERRRLEEATDGKVYGLILLIKPLDDADLGQTAVWLAGARLPLGRSENQPSPKDRVVPGVTSESAIDTLEAIFHPSGETKAQVRALAADNVIERTLVRIVALFGELPSATFEVLVQEALSDKFLPVATPAPAAAPPSTPGATPPPPPEPAGKEWAQMRHYYTKRAGLRRGSRLGFVSDEVRQFAVELCWDEPEEMIAAFAAGHRLGILFSEGATAEKKELFDAYICAALQLAESDPNAFGSQWLDAILTEYRNWLLQTTNIEPPAGDDLLSVFKQILEQTRDDLQREHLRRQFCQRVGYLSGLLLARPETAGMVTNFFARLARGAYHATLWGLIEQVRSSPGIDHLRWAAEILANTGDESTVTMVLNSLAREIVLDPGSDSAQKVLEAMSTWQPANGVPPASALERRALRFLDLLLSAAESAGGWKAAASAALERHADQWAQTITNPQFGEIVTREAFRQSPGTFEQMEASSRAIFGVALALYRLNLVLSEETATVVSTAILRPQKLATINILKECWYAMGERWASELAKFPFDDEHLAQAQFYTDRYELCHRLLAL